MKGSTFLGVSVAVVFLGGCGGMEAERQQLRPGARETPLLGDPTPTLTEVTIDCGDGYPTVADVDNDTLTAIQDSLQAMVDNPAGLLCTLSTSPVLGSGPTSTALMTSDRSTSATSSSNGKSGPFAVGGGRYNDSTVSGCILSFGFSAHNETDPTNSNNATFAHGSVVWDAGNGANQPSGCSGGHVKIDVTCLRAVANPGTTIPAAAEIRGVVREATGQFADIAPGAPLCQTYGVNGMCIIKTDSTDGGKTGNPDTIHNVLAFDNNPNGCAPPTSPQDPLISGNINIKTP